MAEFAEKKVNLDAQHLRKILCREMIRSFEVYHRKLGNLVEARGLHIEMPTIEDHSDQLQIKMHIVSNRTNWTPWIELDDVKLLDEVNITVPINEGVIYRKTDLKLRCNTHNELMSDRHLFTHFRKYHGAESRGVRKLGPRIQLNGVDIGMTPTVIRELIFRKMRGDFYIKIMKLKRSLNIDQTPSLHSEIVPPERASTLHILVAEILDFEELVSLRKIPFGRSFVELVERVEPVELTDSASAVIPFAAQVTSDGELEQLVVNSVQYDVERVLGMGSFAKCYQVAVRTDQEKKVILRSPDIEHFIKNEIELHKICHQHENIVRFLSSFEDVTFNLIMMELCSNGTLSELRSEHNFIDLDDLRKFMRQILSGVDYIHKRNVIHRDLKLSNILLTTNKIVKIGDFGLAIDVNSSEAELKAFCGTVPYLSPEIVNRECAVTKSDVWSVAVIAYFLYKGYRPYDEGYESDRHLFPIYGRIRAAKYRLKNDDELSFQHFIKSAFQLEIARRPTAEECLTFPMFWHPNVRNVIVPRINETVTITPTFVVCANKMYVQILRGDAANEFEEMQFGTLQRMELKVLINPEPYQYVLARYTDGNIYRARLMSIENVDNPKYEIFYVDYGNTAFVNHLYEWHPICDNVPLQAVLMKILGIVDLVNFVEHDRNISKETACWQIETFLCEHLDVKFKATVKSSDAGRMAAILRNRYEKLLIDELKFNLFE